VSEQSPTVPDGGEQAGPTASEPASASDEVALTPGGRPDVRAARPEGAVEVRLRRAPRYRAFVVTGIVLGVLIGAVLVLAVGAPVGDREYSDGTLLRYFGAIGGLLGAVLGAAAALLVERRRRP
jgi:hypothetical protein